tara:strand:- start:564 stop:1070 length:507 start_codon:yes stop_codon:yes gene_type:complete
MKGVLHIVLTFFAVLLVSCFAGESRFLSEWRSIEIPEAGFPRYKTCSYNEVSVLTTPTKNRLVNGMVRTWGGEHGELKIPEDLLQVNLDWICDNAAKGERIFLISCAEKKYQMYSGFMQSESEIKKYGYRGLIDNWAGNPPPIKHFGEMYGFGVNYLPEYLINIVCNS